MYTILVPIDDDEDRARRQERFVSSLPVDPADVRVVLTHVLVGEEQRVPQAMRRPDRVGTVRDVHDSLEAQGFDVKILEASVPVVEGVLELADDVDADLLVMGGRKRSPAGKALFGSVTQAVILESDLPVVVTGSRSDA